MKLEMRVVYEDGTEETVTAGQRDVARWEAEKFGGQRASEEKPLTYMRYISWAASQRTGGRRETWPAWDQRVDYVEPMEDPEESDPTSPGQPPTD